jgi:hypothetical protein
MHIDENKTFDKRTIVRNIKSGIITQKDYESYLSKLPDVSENLFNPEDSSVDSDEAESEKDDGIQPKKKAGKKKVKGKRK